MEGLLLKRNLIAGVLVWLPIWVTVVVIKVLFELFDKIWVSVPLKYHPEVLFGVDWPGVSIIFAAIVLWVTGILVTNFIGRYVINFYESVLQKIPLVRSVYQVAKQAVAMFCSDKNDSFSEVLLIEYPRKGVWSLAFKTNKGLAEASAIINQDLITVFVPTTPNPTSGFLLLIPEKDVKVIDLTIESALKYIVSLGTISSELADKKSTFVLEE